MLFTLFAFSITHMHYYTAKNKQLSYEHQEAIPVAQADEVLIKVQAIGVNRADLLQVEGKYPSPDGSNVPGLEVSGIDVATGEEVCALLTSGAYSEYVIAPRALVFAKPSALSFAEAACLPEALVTVWLNLFVLGGLERGKSVLYANAINSDLGGRTMNARRVSLIRNEARILKPDDETELDCKSVLIHAGASGIGSFAIQAAKLAGAKVIATASTAAKQQFCQKLGADFSMDYQHFSRCENVDVILDILGGEYLSTNVSVLKQGGKLIVIAVMEGSQASIHLGKVLMKNISIIGSTLRSKSIQQKQQLLGDALAYFMPYLSNGQLRPIVDKTFAFEDAVLAHQYMKNRENKGKIALLLKQHG